jgi:enterochelin esterase family protein
MSKHQSPQELTDTSPFARGTVEQHWMKSQVVGDRRMFWVSFPPGYDVKKQYPVAYFTDGDDYLNYGDLPRIMDYLIAHRQVKPFIAVLVRPNNRAKEYGLNDQYVQHVAEELVPWIDSCYPTIDKRSARAVFGVGLGALCAAYIARRCPQMFGLVAGQSGNFGFHNDALLQDYATLKNFSIRFHFTVGEFEGNGDDHGQTNKAHLLVHQRFVDLLRQIGCTVSYSEYPEGHQWGFWRAHIGDALRYFWGRQS